MTRTVFRELYGHPATHSQARERTHHFAGKLQKYALIFWILHRLCGISTCAAQLKPETAAAFDRYVAATEARMNDDLRLNQFLVIDRLPELQRKEAYDQLQHGQLYIEELHAEEEHHLIRIPGGLVHHWVGVIFIPKATLSETDAVLHDYNNEASIYKPQIRRAKLIEQHGEKTKIYLQFYNKSIITVVLDAYFDVTETKIGPSRIQSASRSTRIVEVEDPDGPNEHQRTDGGDHGYMWRLHSYWRLDEKDGGVYMENESITLTRTVPFMLAWLVNPLTKSIPRDVLLHTLTETQAAVLKSTTPSN